VYFTEVGKILISRIKREILHSVDRDRTIASHRIGSDLRIGQGGGLKMKLDRGISNQILYNDIRHCYILKVETCGFTVLPLLWTEMHDTVPANLSADPAAGLEKDGKPAHGDAEVEGYRPQVSDRTYRTCQNHRVRIPQIVNL
jgi:hypothetical protein